MQLQSVLLDGALLAGEDPLPRSPQHPGGGSQLVSVIVLNYNYGRYLRQCIESVLAQDYLPFELIVIDDGSTDDSRSVINSYGNRLVASFKPNGGMVSAMNHGFKLSRGTVVIFVDADDYLFPGAISAHARALRQPAVVRSQTYLRVLNAKQPASSLTIPGKVAADGDLRALVLQRGPGAYVSSPNSGNAWSRRFLERVFPLPENLKAIGAETFLMDSAPLFGNIVTLAEPRAAYRIHDDNMNGKLRKMTPRTVRTVIAQHDTRIAWLEGVATSLGYVASAAKWESGNWRLVTLKYLVNRISGAGKIPAIADHLRPVFGIEGSRAKRSMLAFVILCIRLAPATLSLLYCRPDHQAAVHVSGGPGLGNFLGARKKETMTGLGNKSRYNPAFFEGIAAGSQRAARRIVPLALSLVQARSVVDVGCGEGSWLAEFRRQGIVDTQGLDGEYVPAEAMKIPATTFTQCDLRKPFSLPRKFDLAICLETAEHLPEARAASFVQDIVKLSPQVLFSAAIPFQRGTHHINCQWPDYWQSLFKAHDYVAFDLFRSKVWNDNAVAYWYRQNLILYVRRDEAEKNPSLAPFLTVERPLQRLVHPDLCNAWEGFGFRETLSLLPVTLKKAIGRRLRLRAA